MQLDAETCGIRGLSTLCHARSSIIDGRIALSLLHKVGE